MMGQTRLKKHLYQHTATELAALIREGTVTSRRVIQSHLDRIEVTNDEIGAVTVTLAQSALQAADAVDRGDIEGPLAGVPFTIKESLDCKGSATTFGVASFEAQRPTQDAPAVARLKAVGAIPIARTNMSELGMRFCADNPLRGATINPRAPHLTPGGSSGGDAAAIACGMASLGLGSDLGGSLRNPAHCCGIASLKPTVGRIPHASSVGPRDGGMSEQAMYVVGPMARSVEDLRAALSIMSGRDIRDPRSVDAPLQGPPHARRAALVTRLSGPPLPPSTVDRIRLSGELLKEAGWEVVETAPPEIERACEVWGQLMTVDLMALVPRVGPAISTELYDYMVRLSERHDLRGVSNSAIHAERSRLSRAWSAFMETYPAIIGPTLASLPWPPDADLDPDDGLDLVAQTTRFLTPQSLLGMPALSLPMASEDDVPTGIQICADLWREDVCLEVGTIVERSRGPIWPVDPLWY